MPVGYRLASTLGSMGTALGVDTDVVEDIDGTCPEHRL
jgi:hypothetical protein